MLVKRFGENKTAKWYQLECGKKVLCDEEAINTLWCNWVISLNSKRADTNKDVVFEFIQPVEIDFQTAERW